MDARKIQMRDLYHMDIETGSSLVRELEMAVDRLVSFEPAYCAQFFSDVRLYNLQEAKAYLLNFLTNKGHHDHEAEKNFHEVYDRVVKAFE